MAETEPHEQFRPGDRLGAHTLLCRLAVGGMGSVWSAAFRGSRGFTKLVALKTILHEFADEVQYARALRDEAQLAASLNHPHLCEVTELGEALGYPYLVMEWVDGASLAELLGAGRSRPFSWQPLAPLVAVQIAADVCSGLHALHEARDPTGVPLGAVHRDVSPQNILITQLGHVKVADLGVAKARGQWRARTRSGELRGKLGYLAPEQLLGGSPPDRRADVHAIGCVLYLALSGTLPYPAELGSFELILSGRYRPLHEVCPELPRALSDIVARALATDRAQRFPTALALREELEAWRERQTVDPDEGAISGCLAARLGPVIAARNDGIRSAFERYMGEAERAAEV